MGLDYTYEELKLKNIYHLFLHTWRLDDTYEELKHSCYVKC